MKIKLTKLLNHKNLFKLIVVNFYKLLIITNKIFLQFTISTQCNMLFILYINLWHVGPSCNVQLERLEEFFIRLCAWINSSGVALHPLLCLWFSLFLLHKNTLTCKWKIIPLIFLFFLLSWNKLCSLFSVNNIYEHRAIDYKCYLFVYLFICL